MMQRRDLVTKGVALSVCSSLLTSSNGAAAQALERLPFKADGYSFWTWRGRKIHYVEQGSGQPIVLIHGFGASAFHWRYNIPELAKKYKVYAVDLLGFGWSEKALVQYDATIWMEQVSDFLREVVQSPSVVVGNSLGGFTTLFAATEVPELVRGVVLLNSAGQFADPNAPPKAEEAAAAEEEVSALTRLIVKPLKEAFQRVVLGFLFWQAKQPARVEKVLKSVCVQRSEQRGRVPDQLDHGADGRPERRRGVLQAHVAVRGEPEPVHAGQAAGEADVPAAAAVGGPGPVGRPVQGGKDPRVLRQLHRRQPAGRPLPARRGAGAVQRGAAPVARVAGGGGRRPAGRAQPPGRV
uniref:AB hydrolase-1 domain-containing protein n=1 Tax=Aegilops tauschii subsp. strangulata TaxID=200361 RepID=A0A453PD25_AEGTS